ncbi:hypothetical protein [Sandaracinus amylolyticus]|uniref:Uncharacterized protein n=1 Tax=Sandaracinus amylolyticus TaxID=927083 RepID=A0A0F6VZQ1_9BACT|nr:hypothetical protein [Sandaracinus amylolyticus]AKF03552.1 hypothetical protein DB32_000701 [Sandaracinus amylolyticus]
MSADEEKLRARFADAEDEELQLIARSASQSSLARAIAREALIARGLDAPPELDPSAPRVTSTTRAPREPASGPSTAALARALIAAVIAVIALAIRCGSGG